MNAQARVLRMEYEPRQGQRVVHASLKRFNVLICHRAFGKTVLAINQLVSSALRCTHRDAKWMYIAPYRQQAKGVAWDALLQYTDGFRVGDPNIAELRVDLLSGSRIQLFGADNPNALRGIHAHGTVFDEFADMDPITWTQVVRPALSTHNGWVIFIGTPKGQNAFYDLYQNAVNDDDWYAGLFKASETGVISADELTANRKNMTPDEYAQEFECSFQAPNVGAYWGKEMAFADTEKRIIRLPWEPSLPVTTAWDLGMDDATAIWFCQQAGREIRIIDHYENSGEGLSHYVAHLKSKRYVYGEHLLPHDVAVRELGTGVSRVETLQSLGLNPTVVPAQRDEDGINAARMLLPKCYFDQEKTAHGVKCLRHFQREWAPKLGTWRSSYKHDWSSHSAKAFIYLAQGLKPPTGSKALKYPSMGIV